jgi:RHH-type transcriptional regulator, rel operon repressor / antitoxin RelB
MPTTSFTLRMDTDLKARLEAEAQAEDRSAAWLAQTAISELLERREWKRQAIEEAEAEAEAGLLIDGDAVEAWVKSWGTHDPLPPPTVQSHPFKS